MLGEGGRLVGRMWSSNLARNSPSESEEDPAAARADDVEEEEQGEGNEIMVLSSSFLYIC